MTGYGIGTQDNGSVKYTVELKSLNSKFLELNLRLPKAVSEKEFTLRTESSKLIERGKVNMTVTVEYADQTAKASTINGKLLKQYYKQLKEISEQLGESDNNLFQLALNMPEVVSSKEEAIDETEGKILMDAFYLAIEHFTQFRQDEGNTLKGDLENRVNLILSYLTEVESVEGNRIPLIRERIGHYLEETVGKEKVDMNRFEQEIIFYIDKLDITEEKVRLRSHCQYFITALNGTDSSGKKTRFYISRDGS